MKKNVLTTLLFSIVLISLTIDVFGQNDVTIGTNYNLNLQRKNNGADAFILHNAQWNAEPDQLAYVTTHPTFGMRGIRFSYSSSNPGILFFAQNNATTAGGTFTPTPRFFIGNNGNIGIGTIAPKTLLDLNDLRFDAISAFPAEGSVLEANWGNYIIGSTTGGQKLRFGVANDNYTRAEIFIDNSNRADGTIEFKTAYQSGGALTRMFVDGVGNVGIGTSSPQGYLHVNPQRPVIIKYNGGNGVYGSEIGFNSVLQTSTLPNKFRKLGGTFQKGGANLAVDYDGNIKFMMYAGIDETESIVDYKPQVVFSNLGNLGVGVTSPAYKVDIMTTASETENFFRIRTEDATTDYFKIVNSTGTAGQFITALSAFHNTDNRTAFFHIGNIDAASDNGTNPVSVFDARQLNGSTGALVATRPLFSWDNYGSRKMIMSASGNLAIGYTGTQAEKLAVNGSILIPVAGTTDNDSPGLIAGSDDDFLFDGQYLNHYGFGFHNYNDGNGTNGKNSYISGYYGVDLFTGGTSRIRVNQNGDVGIGTNSPDAKLAVKGVIHTQEVRVDLTGAVAPDYVFEPDYELLSLEEIEKYVKENKHLPEVPSAKEMEEDGLNLKEMNLLLLKKVEELTLLMIEMKKENDKQQKEIEELKNK